RLQRRLTLERRPPLHQGRHVLADDPMKGTIEHTVAAEAARVDEPVLRLGQHPVLEEGVWDAATPAQASHERTLILEPDIDEQERRTLDRVGAVEDRLAAGDDLVVQPPVLRQHARRLLVRLILGPEMDERSIHWPMIPR